MRYQIILGFIFLMTSCGSVPDINNALTGLNPPAATDSVAQESAPLKIIVLDVGQGDSTLIVSPTGESVLIDAGPKGAGSNVILPVLESLGISRLTYIILTHFHEDHMAGIPEVIAGPDGQIGSSDDIRIDEGVIDRGEPETIPEAPSFPFYLMAVEGQRKTIRAGDQIELGNYSVKILAANGTLPDGTRIELGEPPDENAASIALLIEYSGFKMFVAGDITGGGGSPPYQTPDIETHLAPFVGDIDVLRVAHHGSKTSTNDTFLSATTPEIAIISVGDGNDYFHPHEITIERLINAGTLVYQTERGWLELAGPNVLGENIIIEVNDDDSYTVLE